MGGRASHQHVGGKTTDKLIIEPDMIRDTSERVELIRRRIRTAQDRQKSYADKRRTDLEFKIWRYGLCEDFSFAKYGSLTPRIVGPLPTIERVGKMTYKVELPRS